MDVYHNDRRQCVILLPRTVCGVESSCVMIHSRVDTGRVASSREELIMYFMAEASQSSCV